MGSLQSYTQSQHCCKAYSENKMAANIVCCYDLANKEGNHDSVASSQYKWGGGGGGGTNRTKWQQTVTSAVQSWTLPKSNGHSWTSYRTKPKWPRLKHGLRQEGGAQEECSSCWGRQQTSSLASDDRKKWTSCLVLALLLPSDQSQTML